MDLPSADERSESIESIAVATTGGSAAQLADTVSPGKDNSTRFCRYCLVLALALLGYDEAAGLFMF